MTETYFLLHLPPFSITCSTDIFQIDRTMMNLSVERAFSEISRYVSGTEKKCRGNEHT